MDEAYARWRAPSLLLFGSEDPFVGVRSAFEFLETKRTTMQTTTVPAKARRRRGGGGMLHPRAVLRADCVRTAPSSAPSPARRQPPLISLSTLKPPPHPPAQLGHMPQEDYPDAIHPPVLSFLRGEELKINSNAVRMTKRGLELVN